MAAEHLGKLLSLLAAHESKSFDELSTAFASTFEKDQDHFMVACEAAMLLQDVGSVLTPPQRLAALHVLFDLYPMEDLKKNPFIGVMLELLDDGSPSSPVERAFVGAWLQPQGPPVDLFRCSPKELVTKPSDEELTKEGDSGKLPPPPTPQIVENMKKEYRRDDVFLLSPFRKLGVNPLVSDPSTAKLHKKDDVPLGRGAVERKKEEEMARDFETKAEFVPQLDALLRSFEPQFVRVKPPSMELKEEDEMTWMNPPLIAQPLWDYTMCDDVGPASELRSLIQTAMMSALTQQQQARVLQILEESPALASECGLTPKGLPDLAESNPMVALQVILKLINSPQISEYYSTLVSMPMSLHSLEVVNRLATAVELPTEFIHLYISNCIAQAGTITDKYSQNRLVRLVCVFLMALIRNKIVSVEDMNVEVQSFCMEYSRIKEAAGLYKILKNGE